MITAVFSILSLFLGMFYATHLFSERDLDNATERLILLSMGLVWIVLSLTPVVNVLMVVFLVYQLWKK